MCAMVTSSISPVVGTRRTSCTSLRSRLSRSLTGRAMSRQISILLLEAYNLQLLQFELRAKFPNLHGQHADNVTGSGESLSSTGLPALHPARECGNHYQCYRDD